MSDDGREFEEFFDRMMAEKDDDDEDFDDNPITRGGMALALMEGDPYDLNARLVFCGNCPISIRIPVLREGLLLSDRSDGTRAQNDTSNLLGREPYRYLPLVIHFLATDLWIRDALGDKEEAIELMRRSLELDSSDNNPARAMLMQWLPETGDWQGAEKLAKQTASTETDAAYWIVLYAFRARDLVQADHLLTKALALNMFVPSLLIQHRPQNEREDSEPDAGTLDEAISYANQAHSLWCASPGALDWLEEKLPRRPRSRQRPN